MQLLEKDSGQAADSFVLCATMACWACLFQLAALTVAAGVFNYGG